MDGETQRRGFVGCDAPRMFRLFQPDISEMMRVSVGDYALYVDQGRCFSLSAAKAGFKKNCIYHPKLINIKVTETIIDETGDFLEVY